MEEISWTDHVRNGEVLYRVKGERIYCVELIGGRVIGLVIYCIGTAF